MKYTLNPLKNKKAGLITDAVLVLTIVFIFAITVIVGRVVMTDVNDAVQADTEMHAEAKQELADLHGTYQFTFDSLIVVFIAFLWAGMLISSFFIDSHPIFFFITLMALILVLIGSFALVNSYEDITAEGDFLTAADEFPKLNWIMNRLPLFMFLIILSTGVVFYAKSRGVIA